VFSFSSIFESSSLRSSFRPFRSTLRDSLHSRRANQGLWVDNPSLVSLNPSGFAPHCLGLLHATLTSLRVLSVSLNPSGLASLNTNTIQHYKRKQHTNEEVPEQVKMLFNIFGCYTVPSEGKRPIATTDHHLFRWKPTSKLTQHQSVPTDFAGLSSGCAGDLTTLTRTKHSIPSLEIVCNTFF
jgi:hypothetical protein